MVSEALLDELIRNIGTLASVKHQSPALLGNASYVDTNNWRDAYVFDSYHSNLEEEQSDAAKIIEAAKALKGTGNLIENLLDLDFDVPAIQPGAVASKTDNLMDLLSMDMSGPSTPVQAVLIAAETAHGFELKGAFSKRFPITLILEMVPFI